MSPLRFRPKRKAGVPIRSWRVIMIRNRGQLLGWVEAQDAKAAELIAMREFNLSDWQRKRLLVRERA